MSIDEFISEIIRVEGGYVNHPDDRGGPTKYGITQRVLSQYRGHVVTENDVMNLTPKEARDIYWARYVSDPGFDRVAELSQAVAAEVIDTGVNMGVETAAKFLQRALNALNKQGELYPDLQVDGHIGTVTVAALRSYLSFRNESVLVKALNCLQGARYVELCEARQKNESFLYGWLKERVKL